MWDMELWKCQTKPTQRNEMRNFEWTVHKVRKWRASYPMGFQMNASQTIHCVYVYILRLYLHLGMHVSFGSLRTLPMYMCVFVCSESYLWWWQTAKLKMKRSETKHCCSNLRVKASFALLYRIVVYRVYSIVRSNSSYYETIKFTYGWILFLICPPHTHTHQGNIMPFWFRSFYHAFNRRSANTKHFFPNIRSPFM